jgi:hypothetical protein
VRGERGGDSQEAAVQRKAEDAVAASGSQVWVTNQARGRAVRADLIITANADSRSVTISPAGGRDPIQIVSCAYGQPDLPQDFAIALLTHISQLRSIAATQGYTGVEQHKNEKSR